MLLRKSVSLSLCCCYSHRVRSVVRAQSTQGTYLATPKLAYLQIPSSPRQANGITVFSRLLTSSAYVSLRPCASVLWSGGRCWPGTYRDSTQTTISELHETDAEVALGLMSLLHVFITCCNDPNSYNRLVARFSYR